MGDRKSMLVVDDDDALCIALKAKFGEKGYEVTVAKDGEEAIKLLREKDFSVVVTDLHMPNVDGFEVIDQIKTTRNAAVPCYVITNLGSDLYCERAIKLGAKHCFIKSLISLRDIVESIDRNIN